MRGVIWAVRGGLAGRRLQALIVGLVVLAGTATSVVALGLLADAHGPFDHAFSQQRGAEVTATVDASLVNSARLAATARLDGVTAAVGPFALVAVAARVTVPGVSGTAADTVLVAGRSGPGGPVDDLRLDAGHWPRGGGQIVMARGTGVFPGSTLTVRGHRLTVVGVAQSVTGTAQAWVRPAELAALNGPGGPRQAQLLYRFAAASTPLAVAADIAGLRAALPPGALLGTASYLDARRAEQGNIAAWVPFIIAFGIIALVISVLIVVNVVSGAVLAGTTRIGVLKAIGFTPAQVVASYVLLMAAPALAGCAAGAVGGNLLAVPMLTANARVYQVGTLGVPFWVDVTVPAAILALAVAGAIPPALRAGRLRAVQAIAAGRAPRPAHGYRAHRALARLTRLPRPVTLGFAAPFARPARTLVTVAAIVFGAAAATFGTGLAGSLDRVVAGTPGRALPVEVSASTAGLGPYEPTVMTTAQQRTVRSALAAQPGTWRYLGVATEQLNLPGVTGSVAVTGYRGNPLWSGLPLIAGRWYASSRPAAEADVNTLFLTETGTSVGSDYTLMAGGRRVTLRITGEVFRPGSHIAMYLNPAALTAIDPGAGPQEYDVSVRPGVSAQAYANSVAAELGRGYQAIDFTGGQAELAAVVTLISMLTILITVVAGLGVLNTVALQIRERTHDIGVFKAVGMTPRQTLAMIVCSVVLTGLVAGAVAVPAGISLHHGVLPVMAHAANSGYPASLISVYSRAEMVLLGAAGLVIAVAGALGPAAWAARTRTAFALRAE